MSLGKPHDVELEAAAGHHQAGHFHQAGHHQAGPQPTPGNVKALFHVVGDADASFLPRIVGPVAKLGHVPSRLHASAEDGDGSVMTVDLRVVDLPLTSAKRIEAGLRSIVGVRHVIAVYETASG